MKKITAAIAAAFAAIILTASAALANSQDMAYEAIAEGNWAEAETHLMAVLDENPDNPFAMLNLAFVYQAQGKREAAIEIYQRVIELDSNPKAAMVDGHGKRVKSIARTALANLENN